MPTLTRDRAGFQPPLTRSARPVDPQGRWEWPEPIDVPAPAARTPHTSAHALPLAARWESEPLPPNWPPAPHEDFIPNRSIDNDDQDAASETAKIAPRTDASGSSRQTVQAEFPAQVQATFLQSTSGSVDLGQGWASMVSIPAEPTPHIDPSPSRLTYRLNRLWLTPTVRHFVRVGLPIILMVMFVTTWLSDEGRRDALVASVVAVRTAIEDRPQFQVTSMDVRSRSPEVAHGVEQLLGIEFPISSFRLDPSALREVAEALDAVNTASVQVRAGVLEVVIEERLPAMIWRNGTGLDLVDANGHRVARLANRAARPDLPLIAGVGAAAAIDEAHVLWASAALLSDRLRGLVRVGERRWDVVLDRDQRILLPATGARAALERVIALDMAQDILARDVQVVDLRNPARPTLRLSSEAMAELTRIRRESSGASNR